MIHILVYFIGMLTFVGIPWVNLLGAIIGIPLPLCGSFEIIPQVDMAIKEMPNIHPMRVDIALVKLY